MTPKIALLLGIALLSAPAMAWTADQNEGLPDGPKPAIKTENTAPPAMPVPGKTSFTSDQARARMMKRGYNITSNPLKDDKGIWYAEGQKDSGQTVMVMMDYQGNIFEGSEYTGHPSSAPGPEPTQNPPVTPVSPKQR
jgi:hypothetical protein